MRDRPSDVGLPPLRRDHGRAAAAAGVGLVSLLLSPIGGSLRIARQPIFWILFGTFFVCGCSTNGLIQDAFRHAVPRLRLAGGGQRCVLAMMGFFDFFGTIGSGWLSDRFDPRWLLFWYYGLRGCRCSICRSPISRSTGSSPFAVFYGSTDRTVPPTVKITADRF